MKYKKKPWEKKDMPEFKQCQKTFSRKTLKVNSIFFGKVLVFNGEVFGKFLISKMEEPKVDGLWRVETISIECIGRNGQHSYICFDNISEDIIVDKENPNRYLIVSYNFWNPVTTGIIHTFDSYDTAELAVNLGGIE